MTLVVRVNDTCRGYCDVRESTVTATFLQGDNATNVYVNSRELCKEGALATATCGNKVLFPSGSSTVFSNGRGVIRNIDTGTCTYCGNTFTITTHSDNVSAGG